MNYEPAFPMASMDITKGMSLLDYFAGQSLAGLLAAHAEADLCLPEDTKAAKWAYGYAKAMLAERERIMKDSA